jgi:tetratricopeptide (TPR) repeat protein
MPRRARFALAALPLAALLAAPATADEIRFSDGRTPLTNVEVVSESYDEIAYKVGGATQKEPAARIAEIIHDKKIQRYIAAEAQLKKGEYKAAYDNFSEVAKGRLRDEEAWMKHYSLFFMAEALRLMGDNRGAVDAYQAVLADNAKSRFYAQVKLGVGEAKLATGDKAGARAAFQELESDAKAKSLGARWASEASFAIAELSEVDGNLKDALARYEKVRADATSSGDRSSAAVRAGIHASRLRALVDPSKADAAATELERTLAEQWKALDRPADNEVIAAASNALGDVYSKKGDAKKALLNYLRVATSDELKSLPGEGAKALYGAALAFEAAKSEDWKNRSEMMKAELRSRFPTSPWAKKVGG